jgi:N-acetylglucosaminyldiphosphoundecaprenol N-acetyl-beta-D-mannosaminyltransferase
LRPVDATTVDLEVVIVSHRDGRWLERCVASLERGAGACTHRATIVENGGSPIPLAESPHRRVLYVENDGFGAANNVGARGSSAEFLLFLNPDTELVDGTLEHLVQTMRGRPEVGLVAVRQVTSSGGLWPSLHRFPSVGRALAAALASEKWPLFGPRFGERVLDAAPYSRSGPFDWTTGAVLAVRREAFEAVGGFDERFFLFSEETDLCKCIQDAGWAAHVEPGVTFVHHAGKAGVHPPREAQMAYARLQYARKHFGRARAAAYHVILLMHHALRFALLSHRGGTESPSAAASELALRVLLGHAQPPYGSNGAAHPPADTALVMGLPFDRLDERTLTRSFVEGARMGTGGWIVTPNLDILRQYAATPEARDLILAATHRVADGLPIVWASRLAGTPLPARVPGSDLVLTLPEAAADAGLSVFLLGGKPGVAAEAAACLQARHPRLGDVGAYSPPFGFEDDPQELTRIVQMLRAARPDLVLVGLGFPKQERLIRRLRTEMPGTWFAGIGISLSFLAGDQPRAPIVFQRLGLEWLHRLAHEPRRLFRRYIVQGLPFSAKLFGWALARRLRAPGRPPSAG